MTKPVPRVEIETETAMFGRQTYLSARLYFYYDVGTKDVELKQSERLIREGWDSRDDHPKEGKELMIKFARQFNLPIFYKGKEVE